ncbi:acetyltransferase [Methylotuvimicrobium alcaliphilum]|uniref:Acetyltransferase n=1 Tax=Methylotuvimicrobium alcaliphilum (strain DSM 19304 / NCIMB 14124 / VKM B-2133 / 20Z) TaxID=1091494 RepID=G4T1L3_META2|nr:acetyltransferase [Methylotuvimicrobium alcaliphilum]CCE22435.1 putative acetyltransferase [Methylotuvimicrobium alcaliphilum 20Z]
MTHEAETLYIFGAGSFTRCVMHLVSQVARARHLDYWIVDRQIAQNNFIQDRLISESTFYGSAKKPFYFNIPIADVEIREKIALNCLALGGMPLSLIDDDYISYSDVIVRDGAIICARTMITTAVSIGRFFHGNIYSYIEHDCTIGDFVTFSPRVSCNGYVNIANKVFIGAGAIIRNGSADKPLLIGEAAVIGMGAVVTKDVPAFATVLGNPARIV